MRILDIALKDLTQIFRDKRSSLFLVIMPIVFTLLMALTYKDAAQPVDPRLVVGWASQDGEGLASARLFQALSENGSLRLVDLSASADQPETVARAGGLRQIGCGAVCASGLQPAGAGRRAAAAAAGD